MQRHIHTYADNDRYEIKIESIAAVEGGPEEVFLHSDVHKWDKTTYQLLQQELDDILLRAYELGLECVSFYLSKDISTKFHNKLKPLDYETDLVGDDRYVVGGWFTH